MISINHNVLDYWKREGKPKIYLAIQQISKRKTVFNGYVIKDGEPKMLFRDGESNALGMSRSWDVVYDQVTHDLDTKLEIL